MLSTRRPPSFHPSVQFSVIINWHNLVDGAEWSTETRSRQLRDVLRLVTSPRHPPSSPTARPANQPIQHEVGEPGICRHEDWRCTSTMARSLNAASWRVYVTSLMTSFIASRSGGKVDEVTEMDAKRVMEWIQCADQC